MPPPSDPQSAQPPMLPLPEPFAGLSSFGAEDSLPDLTPLWWKFIVRIMGGTLLMFLLFTFIVYLIPGDGDGNSAPLTEARLSVLLLMTAAGACAGAWSAWRHPQGERFDAIAQTIFRYMLAMVCLLYGSGKVAGTQFGTNTTLYVLDTPLYKVGSGSLMWAFFDRSYPYALCIGLAQIGGGLLLLSRRTTILAAAALSAVFANIVLINFFYDIPVKMHSSLYLAFCVYLLCCDAPRLCTLFLTHKPLPPRRLPALFPDLSGRNRVRSRAASIARWFVLAVVLLLPTIPTYLMRNSVLVRTPLYGAWHEINADGSTTANGWRFYLDYGGRGIFVQPQQNQEPAEQWVQYHVNTADHTLWLTNFFPDKSDSAVHYELTQKPGEATPLSVRLRDFYTKLRRVRKPSKNGAAGTSSAAHAPDLILKRLPIR